MNEPSKQRVAWAGPVAAVYAGHPGVRAVLIGGSTARGVAHARSDIDLGVFWTKVPPRRQRSELIQRVGGRLERCVANDHRYSADNPRRNGCIEIVELEPKSASLQLRLDIEHETVAGTDQVLCDVVEKWDLSLEKQELLSVLRDGIVVHDQGVVDRWQAAARNYPDGLAHKMVAGNIRGIGKSLLDQVRWVRTDDWFCLYEGLLDVGRRLLLALMGLNRVWAFTDNPDFKGLKPFVEGLAFKPDRFVHRLGQALESGGLVGVRGLADLGAETVALINAHMPAVDVSDDRERLEQARQLSGLPAGWGT